MILTCHWCECAFRRTNRKGWRKYCDKRCSQAMQDFRRRGVGTPGRKPRDMGYVYRVYRTRKVSA